MFAEDVAENIGGGGMHQRRRRACKVQVKEVTGQGEWNDVAKMRDERFQHRVAEAGREVVMWWYMLLVLIRW